MAQQVKEVSISIYVTAGGSAHFTVKAGGKVEGSHVSPDKPPRISEKKGTIPKDVGGLIFKQAVKVLDEGLDENSVSDINTAVIIDITDSGETTHYYRKTRGQKTVNPEFEALEKLLAKHSIGW